MTLIKLFLILALSFCSTLPLYTQSQELPENTVKVKITEVLAKSVPEIEEIIGTVRPKNSARISAKVTATVVDILVKPGDTVKKNDILAKLDHREAQAQFIQAQADYERYQALLKKQAVTQAEFEAVRTRYELSQAVLSYFSISAPFDGLVVQKFCNAGDLATPGQALFIIEGTNEFRLEATVPDRFIGVVQMSDKIQSKIESTKDSCEGVIEEMIPASDPSSRSFLVKISLNCSKALKSGMFGRANLIVGERPGLFTPNSAIHQNGQLTFVYIVNDGRAQMRLVKTGKTFNGQTDLLSGVNPGEKVIVNSKGIITDGCRIKE